MPYRSGPTGLASQLNLTQQRDTGHQHFPSGHVVAYGFRGLTLGTGNRGYFHLDTVGIFFKPLRTERMRALQDARNDQ